MKYKRTIKLLIVIIALTIAMPVLAVELNFITETDEINVSQTFWVDIMIDTQGKTINTVAGTISYSQDKLKLIDFSDGDSIVTLWLDRPNIDINKTNFAGVIPGGFSGVLSPLYSGGRAGKILSVKFEVIAGGLFTITSFDSEILLHDGLGTPAVIIINNFSLTASKNIILSSPIEDDVFDIDPPEPFTFKIVRDEGIADDKFVVVFNTVDKNSGIDYYEIQEGKKDFVRAISPYILKNQYLDVAIVVRAVDKAGNIQASRVGPPKYRSLLEKYGKWGIIIALIITIVASYFVRRKYNNAK